MQQQITLQVDSAPDAGGNAQDPTVFATTYASIRSLTQRDLVKAQQIAQEVSHMVVIPYLPGVLGSMLIVFDTRTFRIVAIEDPDERQVELRFLALEFGQNAGEPGS